MQTITQSTEEVVNPQVQPQADKSATPAQTDVETPEVSETLENKDESVDTEKKKGKSAEKRIDKLTKQKSDLARELEFWKSQVFKQNQNPASNQEAPKKETLDTSDEPKEENYNTHAEYLRELVKWELKQEQKQAQAKERESKVKTEVQTKEAELAKKMNEFGKAQDDFWDVLDEVEEIPLSLALKEAFLESEIAPQVMYELAKNPEEYERINKLSVVAAAREVGKIEARLAKAEASQSETTTKQTTKAPPPIKPVGNKGTGSVAKSVYTEGLDYSEWEKLEKERLKRRA